MRKSSVIRKLRKNEVVWSTSVSFTNSPKITEIAGLLGYDCIWIDMEHRPYDYEAVFGMIQGARVSDIDCMVRIRKESYASYFRPLEDGAAGIMVPHCFEKQDVDFAVMNAKYPPIGFRGIDGVGADCDYGLASYDDYLKNANDETFVVVQIEDKEAVDNLDEICAVKGVDIIFVGPGDLSKSFEVMGQANHTKIKEAIEKVAVIAKKYGKAWGLPVSSKEDAKKYIDMGARFINIGSDRAVLVNGMKQLIESYKEIEY